MSSNLAKWYHSMTFTYTSEWGLTNKKHGTVNTWDDWHLIPTSRPVFQQGDVKTVYIDIPGSDGILDLTESLSGYPNYKNREGSIEFIVANGWRKSWATGFSQFANWLHGKSLRVVLDDDPNFFYEGRFKLNEWKSNNDGTWSNVTFDYNLRPYKYRTTLSTDDWLWDPFDFETGVIYNASNIALDGTTTFVVSNDAMHVVPTFKLTPQTAGDTFTITLNGTTIQNASGDFMDPRLELLEGDNTITIVGDGTVNIEFRGGSL